jgi:hypothetical protein
MRNKSWNEAESNFEMSAVKSSNYNFSEKLKFSAMEISLVIALIGRTSRPSASWTFVLNLWPAFKCHGPVMTFVLQIRITCINILDGQGLIVNNEGDMFLFVDNSRIVRNGGLAPLDC